MPKLNEIITIFISVHWMIRETIQNYYAREVGFSCAISKLNISRSRFFFSATQLLNQQSDWNETPSTSYVFHHLASLKVSSLYLNNSIVHSQSKLRGELSYFHVICFNPALPYKLYLQAMSPSFLHIIKRNFYTALINLKRAYVYKILALRCPWVNY